MKRRNPLYWDLRSLPEEMFQRRSLARYRKDIDARKILKRGEVKGAIGHLPRKGAQGKWLPSANLFVIPRTALFALGMPIGEADPYGFPSNEMHDWVYDNTQLIRQHVGATNPNDIVYVLSITAVVEQTDEWLTPFMLLHDIMEDVNPTRLESEISALGLIQCMPGDTIYENKQLYIPKLVHVQPISTRPQTHDTVDYYINHYDRNYVSDLWALWCKKEKLTPNHFWLEQTILEFIRNKYAPNTEIPRCSAKIPLDEYCEMWNCYFAKILVQLQGQVVLGA